MTLYCLCSGSVVVEGPRALPAAYKNISGFNKHPNPQSFGWFPYVEQSAPTYNAQTQYLQSGFEVIGQEVHQTWTIFPKPPAPVPSEVYASSAEMALFQAGLLTTVMAAIENHPYEPVRIYFRKAQKWQRYNPYVQSLGPELGLTEEQIDDLFRSAKTFDD